jgi:hypothetical protein
MAAHIDAVLALECDEYEEGFDAALKKVAAHKPSPAARDDPTRESKSSKK